MMALKRYYCGIVVHFGMINAYLHLQIYVKGTRTMAEDTKREELEEYRKYLERLAESKSADMFSNGGIEHAAILMSVLFQKTRETVFMFCEGFKPNLISRDTYWNALKKYLENTKHKLIVLIESNHCQNQKPLQTLHHLIMEGNNNIQVRLISKEGKKIITDRYGEDKCNFAIFDDDKFRFEYDPKEYKAFGSFNQPDECKDLKDTFFKAFNVSQPLW